MAAPTTRGDLDRFVGQATVPALKKAEQIYRGDPGECIESLLISIENGYFVTWDAVIAREKGLLLSMKQEELINGLISFSEDGYDDPILYINGLPRPEEPWYETLRKLAPELILEPFKTYEIHDEMYQEDWLKIVEALETYGQDLTLPEGIDDPITVIPPDILHRLWLQYCFDELSGLGQIEELSLENEDQM